MTKIFVPNYVFECSFGKFAVNAEVELDPETYAMYLGGALLASLKHKVVNEESCLKQAAGCFYLQVYKGVVARNIDLTAEQIQQIGRILNINLSKFATIIGVTRGSLTNFLKGRRRMQRSAQLLALERLGFELLTPGTAISIADKTAALPLELELRKLIGSLGLAVAGK